MLPMPLALCLASCTYTVLSLSIPTAFVSLDSSDIPLLNASNATSVGRPTVSPKLIDGVVVSYDYFRHPHYEFQQLYMGLLWAQRSLAILPYTDAVPSPIDLSPIGLPNVCKVTFRNLRSHTKVEHLGVAIGYLAETFKIRGLFRMTLFDLKKDDVLIGSGRINLRLELSDNGTDLANIGAVGRRDYRNTTAVVSFPSNLNSQVTYDIEWLRPLRSEATPLEVFVAYSRAFNILAAAEPDMTVFDSRWPWSDLLWQIEISAGSGYAHRLGKAELLEGLWLSIESMWQLDR